MLNPTRVARTRWLLPSVLPAALLMPLLALRHLRVIYTSDSAAQQSIVRTWLDVGHGITSVPPDTWALKVPLYLVLEKLPLSPMDRMLAAVEVLGGVTFLLLGWACWKLAGGAGTPVRWYEVAVPLAWLATLGGGIGSNRMLPNYRNIELGLCFALLAGVAGYLRAHRTPGPALRSRTLPALASRAWAGRRTLALGTGAALLLALLWFDDPYFELLVGAPLAVAAPAWFLFRERDRRLLHLTVILATSAVITDLLRAIAERAGIQFAATGQTLALSPATISRSLGLLIPGLSIQLGLNHRPGDGAAVLLEHILLGAGFLMMLLTTLLLARHGWRQRQFVLTFLAAHWPLVVGGYLVSGLTRDSSASRYLILAVCDVVVATAVMLPELRIRRRPAAGLLLALFTFGTLVNCGTSAASAINAATRPSPGLPHQRAVVRAVQRAVAEHGAVKGYAPYWDANIISYLAGERTTAAEIICQNGRLRTRQWLSDTARLTRPAGAVFVIWDPQQPSLAGCPASARDAQLGPPLAVYPLTPTAVTVPGGGVDSVLVYPADIEADLR